MSGTGGGRLVARAAVAILGMTLALAPAAAGAAVDAGSSASQATVSKPARQTVDAGGYRVEVPATWRVVDLRRTPRACVRFDRPTVYLGRPGDEPLCPAHLVGRTAGLVIQPLDSTAAAHLAPHVAAARPGTVAAPENAPSHGGTIQVAVEEAGVLVTAVHTPATEAMVRAILRGATHTPDPSLAPGTSGLTGRPSMRLGDLLAMAPRGPSNAPTVVAPGSFTGRGFDTCAAPSQATMNAWRASSPYRAVGVYIGGVSRACGQPNLTPAWVSTQTANGWHLIPIYVGLQAPCTSFGNRLSSNPATARSQGHQAAADAATLAAALGIEPGSAIYEDMEAYPRGGTCSTAVLSFLAGWTDELHARGYLSGVYSSAASGVADLVAAYNDPAYTRPDHIFFAWWNNRADVDGGSYIPDSYWANGQRIHQYVGDHTETYGGVTINIDNDYLDVRSGSAPPPPSCATATLNFTSYPTVRSGSSGAHVLAVQCLLTDLGLDPGEPDGQFGPATQAAVVAFQQSRGLTADGVVGAHTWTALLSAGSTPTLRNGSTGEAVVRLQRALTAALGRTVGIDGQFGPQTERAVRDYQSTRGLEVDGVVGAQTWSALQTGR